MTQAIWIWNERRGGWKDLGNPRRSAAKVSRVEVARLGSRFARYAIIAMTKMHHALRLSRSPFANAAARMSDRSQLPLRTSDSYSGFVELSHSKSNIQNKCIALKGDCTIRENGFLSFLRRALSAQFRRFWCITSERNFQKFTKRQ